MSADGFADFVRELFAGLGPVSVRRMFGGAGAYAQGRMFALIADEVIYLKTDEALKADLKDEGCEPFVWIPDSGPKKGQRVEMSYWRLPEAALDDPDEAVRWGRRALAAALAVDKKPKAKAASKPKKNPLKRP
jgi:DNA transformation protein and related proteins